MLEAVQQAAEQGLWCVGWLAYEAAAALTVPMQMLYMAPHRVSRWPGSACIARRWRWMCRPGRSRPQRCIGRQRSAARSSMPMWHASMRRLRRATAIRSITRPLTAELGALQHGDAGALAQALFARLQQAQPGGYAALVDSGDIQVLSLSPELFFDWDGERILTRPMKGTAARGKTPQADAQAAQTMRESVKERAENVMIVDLLRNDLSRIAVPHSVKVPQLFQVQAPAVWQMTSDVWLARARMCGWWMCSQPCFPAARSPGRPSVRPCV